MFDDLHVGGVVELEQELHVHRVGIVAEDLGCRDDEALAGGDGLEYGIRLGRRVFAGQALEVLVERQADFTRPVIRVGNW
jgi:hypothetical protein